MLRTLTIALLFVSATVCAAAEPLRYESDILRLRLQPRTHDQMAGFYEARGFPAPMIEAMRPACFITVGIQNKTTDILWLDLSNWTFTSNGKPVKRIDRNEWKQRWQAMLIPLASQSTFRWTLLPEQLDFRPGEHEGGNITLLRANTAIQLDAVFHRGAEPNVNPVNVHIDNIQCEGTTP